MNNEIAQVQFPGSTLEESIEIVVGTRIKQYLQAHPGSSEAEAYKLLEAAFSPLPFRLAIAREIAASPIETDLSTEENL